MVTAQNVGLLQSLWEPWIEASALSAQAVWSSEQYISRWNSVNLSQMNNFYKFTGSAQSIPYSKPQCLVPHCLKYSTNTE